MIGVQGIGTSDWLLYAWITVMLVGAFGRGIPRIWRGQAFAPRSGEDTWFAGWIRAVPVGCVALAEMFIYVVVARVLDDPGPQAAPAYLTGPFFVIFGLTTTLGLTVFLFNWPKRLVPPNRRRQRGVIARAAHNEDEAPS